MNKEQIAEELKMAYAELRCKEDMMNYADEDFVQVIAYEIKALEIKIGILKKRYESVKEDSQEKTSKFWSEFILECLPMSIKKDTASRTTNGIGEFMS